jgi:hypothetical protein
VHEGLESYGISVDSLRIELPYMYTKDAGSGPARYVLRWRLDDTLAQTIIHNRRVVVGDGEVNLWHITQLLED